MSLDLLLKLIVNQFVSGPANKSHNTFDLILSNLHQIPVFFLEKKVFSNRYPIFFSCIFDLIDASIKSIFSRSSFNAQMTSFKFYRSDFFKFLSFNDIKFLIYPKQWHSYLQESFSQFAEIKRAKQWNALVFFSPLTIHLVNQKETNLDNLTEN